jgi:protein gp37
VDEIRAGAKEVLSGFQRMAKAYFEIRENRLYKAHGTFEEFFLHEFKTGRSHSKRIADAGWWLNELTPKVKMAPAGAILSEFNSESHFRALVPFRNDPLKVIDILNTLRQWSDWKGEEDITPALVSSAVELVLPVKPPKPKKDSKKGKTKTSGNKMADSIVALIWRTKDELPKSAPAEIQKIFDALYERAHSLTTRRTSGIEWTMSTWNPLQGCKRASTGCDRCYAAKFIATRAKHRFPGLATGNKKDGYEFTGKIVLLPEKLNKPLLMKSPTVIFTNSMSDLFHADVEESFISAVFDVMEKANWHIFQVLTKRPQRMAQFTKDRYGASGKAPSHIWLGTTTEDQPSFNRRIKHLRDVKAEVKWISCEPLVGALILDKPDGINWVVVGGESDSDRPMKAAWARKLRDQCKTFSIPLFFKQWGSFDEKGKPQKKDPKGGATLSGVPHRKYPGGGTLDDLLKKAKIVEEAIV